MNENESPEPLSATRERMYVFLEHRELEIKARCRIAYIYRVMERRSVDLPLDDFYGLLTCRDLDQLDSWFDKALDATSAADVFA